jgi:hypothetical protein
VEEPPSEKAWRRMLVLRVGEQAMVAMAAMAGRRARRFLFEVQ